VAPRSVYLLASATTASTSATTATEQQQQFGNCEDRRYLPLMNTTISSTAHTYRSLHTRKTDSHHQSSYQSCISNLLFQLSQTTPNTTTDESHLYIIKYKSAAGLWHMSTGSRASFTVPQSALALPACSRLDGCHPHRAAVSLVCLSTCALISVSALFIGKMAFCRSEYPSRDLPLLLLLLLLCDA
jgi:hypothetical protein